MGVIAFAVFWGSVARLWTLDGPQQPLIFVALWLVAWVITIFTNLHGGFFVACEALLAVVMILMIKYKSG
jgi:hypothetical protein